MKTLVVYDSKFGNTKLVAETVAEVCGSTAINVNEFNPAQLAGVALLVVGSPIHNWGPSSNTVHFLSRIGKTSLKGKYVAAFETGYHSALAGKAATRILKALAKVGGSELVPPQKFIVEGSEGPLGQQEIEHAREWSQELLKRLQSAEPLQV
jgi:flavodoxin